MWAWIVSNLVFFKNVAEHKENFYWISQEIVETSATIKCERHERCTPFSITFLCLWKRQINNKHVHTKDSEFNAVIKGAGQKNSWKRQDSKHFQLYKPHDFCHVYSSLSLHQEDSHRWCINEWKQWCFNTRIFTEIDCGLCLTCRL